VASTWRGGDSSSSVAKNVSRRRNVELAVVERQREHVAEPEVGTRCALSGDRDQRFGRIQPGDLGAAAGRDADGVSGAAGDIEQPRPAAHASPVEQRVVSRPCKGSTRYAQSRARAPQAWPDSVHPICVASAGRLADGQGAALGSTGFRVAGCRS
jgi:hypothetical protein